MLNYQLLLIIINYKDYYLSVFQKLPHSDTYVTRIPNMADPISLNENLP